jgi:hypothetical protein
MSELVPELAKFTPLQQELLRVYSLDLEEEHLVQIKEIIEKYLSENVFKKTDEVVEKKAITAEDFEKWAKENL